MCLNGVHHMHTFRVYVRTIRTHMLIPECVQGHRIVCVVVLCVLLCVLCRLKNWMKT